jgi:hypothetical protein
MSKSETRSASLKTLWGEIQVLWVYEIHWLAFGMRDCFRSVFPDVTRGFCWSRAGVLESSSLCGPDRDQEGIVRGLGVLESVSKALWAKSWLALRTRRSSSEMLLVLAAFCLSVSRLVMVKVCESRSAAAPSEILPRFEGMRCCDPSHRCL